MRSGLKNGKLVPPRSLHVARDRYERLLRKIETVETQLADLDRSTAWRVGATLALRAFESERDQLRAWIADALLRRCRDILRSFKDDLTAGELDLLEQLDAYLKKENEDASR